MNELQRQAYLEVMGVESYAPRFLLPGALPSAQCILPDGAVTAVVEAASVSMPADMQTPPQPGVLPQGPASVGGDDRASAVRALLEVDGVADTGARQALQRPRRAAPVEAAKACDIPRFSLSLVKSQTGVLIVDDGLPPYSDYTDYLRLLQNVLFALGYGKQALHIDPFVWPMVNNQQVDQTAPVAAETLGAYVRKQVETTGARVVLVMGDLARRYLSIDQSGVTVINTVSGVRLLTEPVLKAEAWRDLQAIRQPGADS